MSSTQERASRAEALQPHGGTQLAPTSGADLAFIPIIREAVAKGDAEMVHRLLDARDRIRAEEAERAFKAAFIEMWKILPQISKDGKIEVKDKSTGNSRTTRFAKFEDIDELIKPILAEHGFALSFRDVSSDASMVKIEGELMHAGGYSKIGTKCLPPDHGPGRNNVQALGSSDSYAKRYITEDLLNLVRRGADNDGNGAARQSVDRDNRSFREMAQAGEFNRKKAPEAPHESPEVPAERKLSFVEKIDQKLEELKGNRLKCIEVVEWACKKVDTPAMLDKLEDLQSVKALKTNPTYIEAINIAFSSARKRLAPAEKRKKAPRPSFSNGSFSADVWDPDNEEEPLSGPFMAAVDWAESFMGFWKEMPPDEAKAFEDYHAEIITDCRRDPIAKKILAKLSEVSA